MPKRNKKLCNGRERPALLHKTASHKEPVMFNASTPSATMPAPHDPSPTPRPNVWRCPCCGRAFLTDLLTRTMALHLYESPNCGLYMWQNNMFIRSGLTYIHPKTAHIYSKDSKDKFIHLEACNPDGVMVKLGSWKLPDKQYALEAIERINPDAKQVLVAKAAKEKKRAAKSKSRKSHGDISVYREAAMAMTPAH